jgi:hypothetical protein
MRKAAGNEGQPVSRYFVEFGLIAGADLHDPLPEFSNQAYRMPKRPGAFRMVINKRRPSALKSRACKR